MNNTAVGDLFLREETLENTTSATKTSGVWDWRKYGRDVTKDLVISTWIFNAAAQSAGEISILLQTADSADASTWTTIASDTQAYTEIDENARISKIQLPTLVGKIRQYVRVVVSTPTAFTAAPVVSVGLDNDSEFAIDNTLADSPRPATQAEAAKMGL